MAFKTTLFAVARKLSRRKGVAARMRRQLDVLRMVPLLRLAPLRDLRALGLTQINMIKAAIQSVDRKKPWCVVVAGGLEASSALKIVAGQLNRNGTVVFLAGSQQDANKIAAVVSSGQVFTRVVGIDEPKELVNADLLIFTQPSTGDNTLSAKVQSILLEMQSGALVHLVDAARCANQRGLLVSLLRQGNWSIRRCVTGATTLERHGSLPASFSSLPFVQTDGPSAMNPVELRRFRYAEDSPLAGRLILSTYLTGATDPQNGGRVEPGDSCKIRPWVESLHKQRLNGVIFHDQLSDDFVQAHSSDLLQFVRVPSPANYSVNDYRFFVWRDWLSLHPVNAVFFSDLFDVVINRDPFDLLDSDHHLWVSHQNRRIGETTFFCQNFERVYGSVPQEYRGCWELNAGVWGGIYCQALRFLVLITSEFESFGEYRPYNANMPVFNRVMYDAIGVEKLWIKGAPLHSEFQQYQMNADVAFVHK